MLAYVVTILSNMLSFVSSEGLGLSRQILKSNTVLTVFAFNSPPKCKKLSEARLARAEHKAVVTELLARKNLNVPRLNF